MSKKLTLEHAQNLAKEKGGKCLSKKYINNQTKMKWQCKKGHVWFANYAPVNYQTWCPKCAYEHRNDATRFKLEDLQKTVKKLGGVCLSTKYKDSKTFMLFECKKGHIFKSKYEYIRQGHWCDQCGGSAKLTLKEIKQICLHRKGKCLSKEYKGNKTKLEFQCEKGHTWFAYPCNIKNKKSWCSYCKRNKYEEECRRIFQEIYNKPFSFGRPSWLISDKNCQMEFDGYNENLKIAFEYDDESHYRKKDSKGTKKRDTFKKKLCKDQGVILIRIPHTVKYKNFKKYILKKITESVKWTKNKKC